MNDRPTRDWIKIQVHFVCGAILGVATTWSSGGSWLLVCAAGLMVGLLAAVFLDRFWHWFLTWWS